MFSQISAVQIRVFLALAWLSILVVTPQPWIVLQEYGGFTFLGILGAIFANATGAGGGVVFMPFFNQLDFTVATSVATSFAIQCCGMSAGAITWWLFYRQLSKDQDPTRSQWQPLLPVLTVTVPLSIIGVWMVQLNPQFFAHFSDPNSLHVGFGAFSIILSLVILATTLLVKHPHYRTHLAPADWFGLLLVALIGGGITAWLSIGVGELLAVYLIVRGFNVTFAIAAAVILSAFTVWGGIIFHLVETQAVYWPVVLFAGAGAIMGGIVAKHLVLYFSTKHLKLFFAAWIGILGITALPF